ncbi:shikimate dehydrogenase [Corynebacterium mayonis]|uniref:shikimate dehydrogenase n=1 Tax=Corynebacterium mayonis TaxID=3062461 RepID=UPI00313FF450
MDSSCKAAVLGSPIAHSLSPVLHRAGYEAAGLEGWEYERIECTAEDLPRIVGQSDPSYRGFSVTMPAKFAAVEFADVVTERARAIGSANTLVRTDEGWRADNTDTEGIAGALDELLGATVPSCVLVIGAGGTARPTLWTLAQRGVERIVVLNRSDRRSEVQHLVGESELRFVGFEEDIAHLAMNAEAIVSTVPADALEGKVDAVAHAPVLDVIYNPWPTPLAAGVAANGHKVVGGLSMLAAQSYSQFEQFTGVAAPREEMRTALAAHVESLRR